MQLAKERLVATLTVEELISLISNVLDKQKTQNSRPNYIYGLRGIQKLFGVSHVTAQHYKDTFLAPAVRQRGRTIIVDADLAVTLFEENKGTAFFMDGFGDDDR